MTYPEWVDLAVAFVRVEAAACGWSVLRERRAKTTRSVYLDLAAVTGDVAVVRLSDHRCRGRAARQSLFSVRQRATVRLRDLRAFLTGRIRRVDAVS